ncbi:MAG: GTP-binding protein TypA [Porticoccaceae bacterium]|nr:MAG: GTP-binding protein TypA [Porticoccaceae bacterium]
MTEPLPAPEVARLRNVAIVAHVDHGKTTLVDKLLAQSGTLHRRDEGRERLLDSHDQERERGITILAKNTALSWRDYRINVVDTPGHADFGGEVERVLAMVDSVLLLVDAVEGPMPQTRFVTRQAFARGLRPLVVVNKVDRPGARPHWVVDQVFELFDRLGASEAQLDFPVIYASALLGRAGTEPDRLASDLTPLFEAIVQQVPSPAVEVEGPFRMQVAALDYDSYVGVIGVGRVERGRIRANDPVVVTSRDGSQRRGRVLQVLGFHGLERVPVAEGRAGDILCVTGLGELAISDTLCDPKRIEPLPPLAVEEPTVHLTLLVNDSPFAGREGRFLTSRQLGQRLEREALHNVAIRVAPGDAPDRFQVAGRGELQLAVLLEELRREGFELAVSRPEVIRRRIDGALCEPFERVVVDVEEAHQGAVMEAFGARRGELLDMQPDGRGRVRFEYRVPSRGLLGFRVEFLTLTAGSGILTSSFDGYGPAPAGEWRRRANGVLVSTASGKVLAYALYHLQERGRLFVAPGEAVYEGQIVGIHNRANDLPVNPTRAKQLTNIRAAGSDENLLLTPPLRLSLEQALEFIEADELVEVTPQAVRLRKKYLKESERRRAERSSA